MTDDIQGALKTRDMTSRDMTRRDQVTRTDIARKDSPYNSDGLAMSCLAFSVAPTYIQTDRPRTVTCVAIGAIAFGDAARNGTIYFVTEYDLFYDWISVHAVVLLVMKKPKL